MAKTRAKKVWVGAPPTPSEPGQPRQAGRSAREEAIGSNRHREPGQTLERRKPKKVAVSFRSASSGRDVDVAGGSNPLERPVWPWEGTALVAEGRGPIGRAGDRTFASRRTFGVWPAGAEPGGSGGGPGAMWKTQEGKAGRKAASFLGDGPALKGEPHERCGGGPSGPQGLNRRQASRGETRPRRRNVTGAIGWGWDPGAWSLDHGRCVLPAGVEGETNPTRGGRAGTGPSEARRSVLMRRPSREAR